MYFAEMAQVFQRFHGQTGPDFPVGPCPQDGHKHTAQGGRKILVLRDDFPAAIGTFEPVRAVPKQIQEVDFVIPDGEPGVGFQFEAALVFSVNRRKMG